VERERASRPADETREMDIREKRSGSLDRKGGGAEGRRSKWLPLGRVLTGELLGRSVLSPSVGRSVIGREKVAGGDVTRISNVPRNNCSLVASAVSLGAAIIEFRVVRVRNGH